jgi:para-aminobenzoate synthetase component 2
VPEANSQMVLIIDNYDSFVYNLAQYLGELGWQPVVHRNDQITLAQIEEMAPSHIIISPGPCTPLEAGISDEVVRRFAGRIPILGVCLGHQCIGHVYGGKIGRTSPVHGKTSAIHHDGRTIYQGLPNPFQATRYHSLVIEAKGLPACLEVTAKTSEGTIMGVRHRQYVVEGVQFHPESILTEVGHDVLRNFLGFTRPVWDRTQGLHAKEAKERNAE